MVIIDWTFLMKITTAALITLLKTENNAGLTEMVMGTVLREYMSVGETLATITASMITRPRQLLERGHGTSVATISVGRPV